ncbi:MAG: DUF362 domain-containing protein [Spirochaetales bacterium]|nr:DUF362 domain-containing protein [Spirochaetales bacterium]
MNTRVALLKCEEYNADVILDVMRESLALCGGNDALNVTGKKILLKPNVLFDSDVSKAVTTHPEFLRAAIRLMKELGASEIYAGDSPGFQKPGFRAKRCGLSDVCLEEGVTWYDFSHGTVLRNSPEYRMVNQFMVSDIVDKVDLIISLPKLKTHQLMYFTGAIKNQFGLIPGLSKSPYHMMFPGRHSFAQMLVDLHTAVKPAFAFMDAIVSMEGPGPGSGFPRQTGLLLASSNLLALDITACRIIGYDPDIIPVNKDAIDRGIWLESSSDPEVLGLSVSDVKIHNFKKISLTGNPSQLIEFLTPRFLKKLEIALSPRPVFIENTCIRCGQCVKICPADALKLEGMILIDYEKCIRCFCCHEVCPEDAIKVKRSPFTKGVM